MRSRKQLAWSVAAVALVWPVGLALAQQPEPTTAEQLKALKAQIKFLQDQMSEQNALQQKNLAELKAELTKTKAELTKTKAELSEQNAQQQKDLANLKAELTKTKADLTEQNALQQKNLANQQADLTKTKAELTNTKATVGDLGKQSLSQLLAVEQKIAALRTIVDTGILKSIRDEVRLEITRDNYHRFFFPNLNTHDLRANGVYVPNTMPAGTMLYNGKQVKTN